MRRSAYTLSAASGVGVLTMAIAAWIGGAAVSARPSDAVRQTRGVERAAPSAVVDGARQRALHAYANLPIAFVENRGQTDARVRYYASGPRYGFYFTRDEVVMSFMAGTPGTPHSPADARRAPTADPATAATDDATSSGVAIALRFLGDNPGAWIEGRERAPGETNDFRGNDRTRWQTALPSYGEIVYRERWPGVDLLLREQAGALKYEFRLRPGARVADIGLAYRGSNGVSLDDAGALLIATEMGVLRDAPPVAYQMVGGVRVPVESRYVLGEENGTERRFGFAVGSYQPDRELIIDPGVEYSTFLGGANHEIAAGIDVDAAGNVYVVGTTQSPDFPTTPGAFRRTGAAGTFGDVFVSKLNPSGTALVYSTFIGGSNFDFGRRIAIDAAGNAYVTGLTKSSNFPTTGGAFDRSFNILNCPRCGIDQYDAFVTKLNAAGSALVYSTFLGGTDIDDAHGIAVDGSGNAYVTGETLSADFPTTAGAFDRTRGGQYDVFVTKLNAAGSALVYSTFLGGTQVDNGERVQVNGSGNAYVMGFTSSTDFPTTVSAFDTSANGAFDVFVTKLNPAGSALVYSTYLGGEGFDSGGGLALDAAGSAYVSGAAGSIDFPTTPGAFDQVSDGGDAFITKVSPAGSALDYSTMLGGTGGEGANGVDLDAAGNAWVTGVTNSVDFPVTAGAFDPSFNGTSDAFVSKVSANGLTLLYSTYLGGALADIGNDVAVDVVADAYVAGHTYSLGFPVTLGALDTIFNGDPSIFWGDAFITKIANDTDTSTPPAPPGVPPAPALLTPSNGDNPTQPVAFDWSDVPSAVSYTIQIDDSSGFTAPLVRDQSVAASWSGAGGLPVRAYFWRVRGVNSAGTAGAWSATRTFTPQAAPPPATLSTLSLNPETVVGGTASSGTAVFDVLTPEAGATIALSSSHPAIATVPAQTTAAPFSFTATFAIATAPVSTSTVVTITATYNGTTRTATLTVTSSAPAPPTVNLQTLMLAETSVAGGSSMHGNVILSGLAPQAGATVMLSSSHPAVVSVPGSVTVPGGFAAATFTGSTSAVGTSTTVTISATYNGTTRTAPITVTATAPPPPPPQTATLSVNATGRNGERVTSNPAGISVATGGSGSASFATGTSITLSVSDGRDAVWSGACSSGGNKRKSCTFTLTTASTVSANVN